VKIAPSKPDRAGGPALAGADVRHGPRAPELHPLVRLAPGNRVHEALDVAGRDGRATEFTYERTTQPSPKIDPWRSELDQMLAENARRPKRERLTLIRIYEELRNLGYDGSYDAVRRYASSWSKATQEASASAYVPLSFDPGEAYQFDWSHEIVMIDGVTTTSRSPMSACATAGCRSFGPIRARRRRWCSMPMTGRSPSSAEPVREASTTT
jgi:hypothetical protein